MAQKGRSSGLFFNTDEASFSDRPTAPALRSFLDADWAPEQVAGTPRCVYVGYERAGRTRLTNAALEKALGVSCTARTPATLRKLLPS